MALPMLFTACSQDELFEDYANNGNMPDAKGYYMTLAPTLGDMADSRATWLDSNAKLTWDNTDKISVYWLGATAQTGALEGKFNSIFKTEDGNAFTSESMVFVGGNIAVYPANTSFVKQGALQVQVPLSQNENTINETPYVSNYLTVNEGLEGQENQLPGYNNGLYSPMKLAANVLYLDIDLANTADLAQYGFRVDSVSLQSVGNKFAGKAGIHVSSVDPFDKGKVTIKDGSDADTKPDTITTINKSVYVQGTATSNTLTAKAITKKAEGKYQAKFVVLPTDVNTASVLAADKDAKVIIYTNCGRIELATTKTVTTAGADPTVSKEIAYTAPAENVTNIAWAGLVTGAKDADGKDKIQTIAELVEQVVTSQHIPATANSNFKKERAGMAFARAIKADMANATLNDSYVKNSEEIKNYINIYTSMKSVEDMNLILSADEGSIFKTLTKEAIAAIDAKNIYPATGVTPKVKVTLSMGEGMTGIEVVGGGEVYNAGKSFTGPADLILEAGKEWTMNDNAEWDNVSSIVNNGTLTVAGTTKDGVQNSLTEVLVNNGTLKIGGNNILQVADKLRNITKTVDDVEINGIINVVAGQDLVFNTDVTAGIEGIINVAKDAFITVAKDKTVVSEATINNNGTVSSIVGNGGWTNNGIINVLNGNAITYVQKNANGIINLFKRSNEVVVKDDNQGKIVYNWNDGADFKFLPSDKFTYVVFDANKTSEINLPKRATTFKSNATISFEITGGTINLTVADVTADTGSYKDLYDLKVAKGATLTVYSGNDLTVHCLTNEGNITIGGTIKWSNTFDNFGVVRSVGSGAILAPEAGETAGEKLEITLTLGDATMNADVRTNQTLNMVDNKTLDGQGYTLSVGEGSSEYKVGETLRFIEMKNGGTITNLVIDGNNATYKVGGTTYGIRAMYLVGAGIYNISDVIVKNVTYTINDDAAAKTLNVTNSTLEGWTSYNPNTTATFNNVKFEVGPTQGTFRPHGATTLTDCSFEDGFVILLDKAAHPVTFTNCYYNGVKIESCTYDSTTKETTVTLVNEIKLVF